MLLELDYMNTDVEDDFSLSAKPYVGEMSVHCEGYAGLVELINSFVAVHGRVVAPRQKEPISSIPRAKAVVQNELDAIEQSLRQGQITGCEYWDRWEVLTPELKAAERLGRRRDMARAISRG